MKMKTQKHYETEYAILAEIDLYRKKATEAAARSSELSETAREHLAEQQKLLDSANRLRGFKHDEALAQASLHREQFVAEKKESEKQARKADSIRTKQLPALGRTLAAFRTEVIPSITDSRRVVLMK